MIELDNTGIREIRKDGTFIATTTFTVESPVPGTFSIEVAGKTITEAVDNLVDYIREHSDEEESILLAVKEILLGFMEEGEKLLRIKVELSSALCKATWTGDDALKYFVDPEN